MSISGASEPSAERQAPPTSLLVQMFPSASSKLILFTLVNTLSGTRNGPQEKWVGIRYDMRINGNTCIDQQVLPAARRVQIYVSKSVRRCRVFRRCDRGGGCCASVWKSRVYKRIVFIFRWTCRANSLSDHLLFLNVPILVHGKKNPC